MKTLVLFHRLELTNMFAALARELDGNMTIVHLAYGADERELLRSLGVTDPIITFKDEVKRLWDLLEMPTTQQLAALDECIVDQTGGAFNLNGAIQSDRGFTLLTYAECLKLTFVYYQFWEELLSAYGADFVMHEPTSLMMNFIAAVTCGKHRAQYLYHIMCGGDRGDLNHLTMSGFDFTCPALEAQLDAYRSGAKRVDRVRCDAYLQKFRSTFDIYLGANIKPKLSLPRLAALSLRNNVRARFGSQRWDRITDNIDYWMTHRDPAGRKLVNLIRYHRQIRFHNVDPGEAYFYYPMHLEPEAVVLYHGHGLYRNQVKLIENIAAQLPAGVLLYVKDHPHDFGYRSADDYLALQQVPNVRLIRHDISGKQVIKDAIGVITITGTAGFEALLLNKQVFTFGKTFYSPCRRVRYVRHVRDLREALYRERERHYEDDEELYWFVAAYLESLNEGLTDYFAGRASRYGVDLELNAKQLAAGFLRNFNKGELTGADAASSSPDTTSTANLDHEAG